MHLDNLVLYGNSQAPALCIYNCFVWHLLLYIPYVYIKGRRQRSFKHSESSWYFPELCNMYIKSWRDYFLIIWNLIYNYSGGGIPHLNQSAYKNESCTDAIFAIYTETLLRFLQEKCSVYMCLYDIRVYITSKTLY